MAERTPSPPTYGGPPLSSYAPPQDWRSRFTGAGNSLQSTLSYYAGPHLSAVAKPLSELVQMVSPAADIIDAGENYKGAIESARSGDVPGAVAQTGYGLLSNLGLSEVSKPVAAIFAGVGAKTADLAKLKQAEALEGSGADATKVWNETGWFRGADGKWRFEIDDSWAYSTDPAHAGKYDVGMARLPDVMAHQDLYSAYPDTANVWAQFNPSAPQRSGTYYQIPETGTERIKVAAPNAGQAENILLHEAQHAVQGREGFAGGGDASSFSKLNSPEAWEIRAPGFIREEMDKRGIARLYENSPEWSSIKASVEARIADETGAPYSLRRSASTGSFPALETAREFSKSDLDRMALEGLRNTGMDEYQRLAGEVEARNVQTRRDYTPEQRKAAPPWTTEDVPRDRQIVRMSNRDVLDKLQQMRAGK